MSVTGLVENVGEGENAGLSSLRAIYPFPAMFSKDLYPTHKNQGLFGKRLTKQQNFRLDQVESICRQQNKRYSKIDVCFCMSRKQPGRRRKYLFLKHDPSLWKDAKNDTS